MTTYTQVLQPGDSIGVTAAVPVPPPPPVVTPVFTPITDLQAALNTIKPGGMLDCTGQQPFSLTHLVVPPQVTLFNPAVHYNGAVGAAQTAMVDLSAGSVLSAGHYVGGPYAVVRPWLVKGAQILNVDISGGPKLGVIGYQCDGLVVQGGRIHDNNPAGGQEGYEAGGIKLGDTAGYLISGVQVDTNKGPGIWEDASCASGQILVNLVHDNTYAGIMSEISRIGALIQGNAVWECGWGDGRITSTALWGAAILLSSTTGAQAKGNTVAWCPAAIGAISQMDPSHPGQPRVSTVKGTTATNNVYAITKGSPVIIYAESGAPTDWGPFSPNAVATAAQLAAAGIPAAPQPGH